MYSLVAVAVLAIAGNPWEDLMGPGKPQIWSDPQGRFYLDLPVGWTAQVNNSAPFVDFWKTNVDYGYVAHVEVEMRGVPPGTKAAHFAERVQDELKKSAPGYKVLSEDRMPISGVSAVRRYFTFQEKNNAQLLNEVVQHVFVIGERAFIVSLITAAGARPVFWEDFEKMVKGFGGRAPGDESLPMPKQRKKIKSGEMVNPDAVQY